MVRVANAEHTRAVLRAKVGRLATHAVLIVSAGAIGLPFLWMLSTSFKSDVEVGLFPPVWIPAKLLWENYVVVWNSAPFDLFYINSTVTTVVGLLLSLVVSTLAAYAFARIEFPHRDLWFLAVLATMMVPGEMALVPNYLILRDLNWINTYQGIIVPHIASAFGCFLLRQAFLSLPAEVFDSARIDGAGHLRMMFNIALPMARPVFATLALFLFIGKWNAYLWPLVVTNTWEMRTLPIGLRMVRDAESLLGWQHLMAGSLLVMLPVLAVFVLAQQHIIEGIGQGAVKG